ncbi:isocitrate lyase/phosphoenolpyruvate mutase family protein [Micromonospora sp. NPDC006766]|uniref:isocitrate lyase/phosphoenolpyruvate mutase family protein n=1 Tax=Micromonospora sp. NPDC006766 TaxID=3154778 RepID=UPI0033F43F72
MAETVARARAYLAAGADGVFVPGTVELGTLAALVEAIPAPLNVLAGPGAPAVAELAKTGVARVSLGSSVRRGGVRGGPPGGRGGVRRGTPAPRGACRGGSCRRVQFYPSPTQAGGTRT